MTERQVWSQRYRFVGPESYELILISIRTGVRDQRTRISYYVQLRTMNRTINYRDGNA
jgi:hypothetical protein